MPPGGKLSSPAQAPPSPNTSQPPNSQPITIGPCRSNDPAAKGAPSGFTFKVRELKVAAGAGWLIAICGDMVSWGGAGRGHKKQAAGPQEAPNGAWSLPAGMLHLVPH